uniref:Uncharacterized protein n=1 Tax=Fagus sylvatica TaxID=28930 RepID=A0A2N9EV22_FAGSY
MAEIQHVVSMGERSSDSEEAETQSISISLKARFKTVNEAAEENKKNKSQSPTPKIQKVIFLLRDTKDFEKYYEPRVVSLGPIHHGKEKYQLGEKYKLLLTSEFVKGSCKGINALYMKIERRIKKLKVLFNLLGALEIRILSGLQKDCFEEEVIKKYDGDDEGLAWLLFVDGCAILQYMYCATNKDKFNDLSIKNDSVAFADQDLFLLENQVPYCLLKWLMRWSKNKDLKNSIETFIKGLACCLGYLWLPPITVDDSMRPKFLNLIAYEMSLDFKNDFGITSYISFLDSLIDEANDVKLLRKAGVLYNCLGSDEEVAKLFNEIGTDLVPSTEIYSHVRSEIQKHYNNTLRNWIAQVIHDHFSSPWTFIAFFGALLALALLKKKKLEAHLHQLICISASAFLLLLLLLRRSDTYFMDPMPPINTSSHHQASANTSFLTLTKFIYDSTVHFQSFKPTVELPNGTLGTCHTYRDCQAYHPSLILTDVVAFTPWRMIGLGKLTQWTLHLAA